VVAGLGLVLSFQSGSITITVTNDESSTSNMSVVTSILVDGSIVHDETVRPAGSYSFVYTDQWNGFVCTSGKVQGQANGFVSDDEDYGLCDGGSTFVTIDV
jgi:hypothetical protein